VLLPLLSDSLLTFPVLEVTILNLLFEEMASEDFLFKHALESERKRVEINLH
jgi:hypothetical protein